MIILGGLLIQKGGSFMTLKHLLVFVTVFEEESITLAGRKLGMTQPATSLAIKQLEDYYSTRLFDRNNRRIYKAAKQLYAYAAPLISSYEEMDNEMKNWDNAGKLRIGSSISIGTCLMPNYIKFFRKQYPDAQIYLKIDSSDVIEKMVAENKLDFAVIEGNVHLEQIISEPFLKDNLSLICNRFHPLAEKDCVTLKDLEGEAFLLREKNSGTRELAEAALAFHNFSITPAWESTSTTAIINGVIAGLGISILPKRLVEPYTKHRQVVALEIEGISFERTFHIIYHKNKYISTSIQNFLTYLKNQS